MSEYLIQDTTLTGIADKIRPLLGLTGTMTPEQMQTNLTTEQANITAALAALAKKGVEVPAGANSNALAGLIAAIEAGGGKIEKGVYIPAEDVALSSNREELHKIELNLSFNPMIFCMFYNIPYNSSVKNKLNAMILINAGYNVDNMMGDLTSFSCGTNASGSFVMQQWNFSAYSNMWINYLSAYVACVYPHMSSGAILPAGKKYHWMAFGEAYEGVSG